MMDKAITFARFVCFVAFIGLPVNATCDAASDEQRQKLLDVIQNDVAVHVEVGHVFGGLVNDDGAVETALDLLESARHPRTTVQTPFRWPGDPDWRDSYLRVDDSNREALRRQGEERRAQRARDRADGRVRG